MKNIAVALPYAVSIRDFVNGGTFEALSSGGEFRLTIYTLNPDIPELEAVRAKGFQILPFTPYENTRLEAFCKRVYPQFFSDQMAYLQLTNADNVLRRLFGNGMSLLRRMMGPRLTLKLVGSVLAALNSRRHLPDQLTEPADLFIGTRSLVNSVDYGLVAEANRRGIPMLTLASSWDNFTTKGYFPFPTKGTVVWNEQMREELLALFDVEPDKIVVAGYPRARLLQERVRDTDPETYLSSIGIDGYKRFVLYSASYGELTRAPGHPIPLEYEGILSICAALEPTLPEDVCILIRLHPFSNEKDRALFATLPRCHVFVPGRADKYVERVMGIADEEHLATQLARAEAIVSLASTVSIDALCLRKAIINVDFDVVEDVPLKWSSRRFYQFNHFRDLLRTARLPLAKSIEEVVQFVHECLAGRHVRGVDMPAFERMYVPPNSADYPQHVRQAVKAMTND
ncbi:hypothetical protein [Rhizobium sp. AG855]|uniref:hypothetical protein n=1 Tax=Rhizobium sp. AG855 TaxID=2183898 RepID=UPI000E765FB7|nr:hypothetical protein [Rhizobium sp. AG855]RKE85548.1 hypothetical protein DFO46_2349 [Rhizobium sp. AG855]